MGWSFRKSIKLGPIRLNLSKSGLGVSTGIRGFRVSSGPRGTYLRAGRGGIYYTKRLDSPAQYRALGGGHHVLLFAMLALAAFVVYVFLALHGK